ncbi:aldose 1-epimerase family protein [Mucilaginibacter ginkgonis]|uniref:Aldose 1-epimerase family protein n=1 Tax=Mucilaginibacter ginkgonis TaxID=2682091 RepID=A0A6I4HVQ0_9SPHI|nr:aldose 1-epimerase family protein [Mucilaginibacter ginkgonis]QQL49823.1 aldose 1-epimerase family protein [Mucilaginibacter ginkgonis]
MTVIENEYLRVSISTQGAELHSVFNKQTGVEQLWQANPDVWPWHAPNLFPVVGGLINDELHVDGQNYAMKRHGFARQSEFKMAAETTKTHALFSLHYNDETLKVYPYKFTFQIIYDLIENSLRVTYKVINLESKPVYFSVGGHPAFNVPFNAGESYEDYYLEFETTEALATHRLSAEGYFNGETDPVQMNGNKLRLTRQLFDNDALVFKQLNTRQVTIKSDKHDQSLSVEFPHFNYLGIWAKPGADFVCIEPWLGCADTEGKQVDISQKECIQKVEQGHVFESSFYVSV